MKLSTNTKRAIKKYGEQVCRDTYKSHKVEGNGASTIGFYWGLTTNQADAAINAGRELSGDTL
jgi:hypothetical protein